MTNNSGEPGEYVPDLTKRPDDSDTTQTFTPPANPHPAVPPNQLPSDQFTPYTPPQYGDPLHTPYPAPQHHPAPGYGTYPVAGYPSPGFSPGFGPSQAPAAVGATRALGAVALVGALLFIAYGWLTWASFVPRFTDAERISVNGWGQVFSDGIRIPMESGTSGMPYAAGFLPFYTFPVAILGLLVVCNVGRFGNAIAILALSAVHLVLALGFLAFPEVCILFDNDADSALFEELNRFSTGPGAILATITLAMVVGTSIAGIILGRKTIYTAPPTPSGYAGYPGF